MTYYDQLFPWVVYRLLPNCQRLLLERFRKRNDAEAYLRALNLLQPSDRVEIVFETQASEAKTQRDRGHLLESEKAVE